MAFLYSSPSFQFHPCFFNTDTPPEKAMLCMFLVLALGDMKIKEVSASVKAQLGPLPSKSNYDMVNALVQETAHSMHVQII